MNFGVSFHTFLKIPNQQLKCDQKKKVTYIGWKKTPLLSLHFLGIISLLLPLSLFSQHPFDLSLNNNIHNPSLVVICESLPLLLCHSRKKTSFYLSLFWVFQFFLSRLSYIFVEERQNVDFHINGVLLQIQDLNFGMVCCISIKILLVLV